MNKGFPKPLPNCLHLQRVARGIKSCQGSSSSSCLPFTDDLMLVICRSLDLRLPDHCMFFDGLYPQVLWLFAGFQAYCTQLGQLLNIFTFECQGCCCGLHFATSCMCITIKGSRTDPFREGCSIHIGLGRHPPCAVYSLMTYLHYSCFSMGSFYRKRFSLTGFKRLRPSPISLAISRATASVMEPLLLQPTMVFWTI